MAAPKKLGDVLAQLVARRGYVRDQAGAALDTAWRQAAGDHIAKYTCPGNMRGGTLEVTVANNLLVQELGFQKADILEKLAQFAPGQNIRDLRFRVGQVS
jgi:predicted nucleic acid-binding Zn ribbon protein